MEMVCKCKIARIVKDDKKLCSARVIFATLVDDAREEHHVEWVSGPAIERARGGWDYKETEEFTQAWEKAEVGMEVNLYCADGMNRNYFLIANL